MRLLDEATDRRLDRVTVYLTQSEAEELRDSLMELLANPIAGHSHVSSSDYRKEITVCVYDPENLTAFSERSRRLIVEDK